MNAHLPIQAIRDAAQMIRDMLGEDDDSQAFLDTLDGETDVMDCLGSLIKAKVEAEAMALACQETADKFEVRAKRMQARSDAARAAMGMILDAIGTTTIAHPLGTITRTKPHPSVKITDINSVPTQLCRIQRAPDKIAIRAQIEAGETVPGAVLEMGQPGIRVGVR